MSGPSPQEKPLDPPLISVRLPLVIYRTLAIFAFCLTLPGAPGAKRAATFNMTPEARLYVAPMEWNLDRFVIAEIRRQGLPVQLVTSADQADFVMTSLYQTLGSHLIAPGHYIQVRISTVTDGSAVWADEVNDFAVFFGRLRRHGPRKAAEAIVRKLRTRLTGIR
jgi:hypothetical protein